MLTRDMSFLDEVKTCPHCKTTLSCCEAPPIHIGDGLGWGSEVLFICLNDECPLYVKGWKMIEEKYGHNSSYRYMELPGSTESNVMMVGTPEAFKGFVVDKEAMLAQNKRFQEEKAAREALQTCVAEKNLEPVLHLILDEAADRIWREKALQCLVDINDVACIDPLRNHKFRDPNFESDVNLAIAGLLKKNYKKECPACMEIVKSQAKVCMFCKAEL